MRMNGIRICPLRKTRAITLPCALEKCLKLVEVCRNDLLDSAQNALN